MICAARPGPWKPSSTTRRPGATPVSAPPSSLRTRIRKYGGTMHTKAVFQGVKGLTRIGCAVLRFNFRGVGRSDGVFDKGEGEIEDLPRRARLHGGAVSGRAAVGRRVLVRRLGRARNRRGDDRVSALIGIAPPVMTSATVSGMDYEFPNTLASTKAKFFVQGEEDELVPLEGMRVFYAQLEEPKELVVIEGADHLFEGKTAEVGEALEELLGDF
jgi:uncharacterized protein